jgi:hypothetical protein
VGKKKVIGAKVSEETYRDLQQLSKTLGVSVSKLVRDVVEYVMYSIVKVRRTEDSIFLYLGSSVVVVPVAGDEPRREAGEGEGGEAQRVAGD